MMKWVPVIDLTITGTEHVGLYCEKGEIQIQFT